MSNPKFAALFVLHTYSEWITALDEAGLRNKVIPPELIEYVESGGYGMFRLKPGTVEEEIIVADLRAQLEEAEKRLKYAKR